VCRRALAESLQHRILGVGERGLGQQRRRGDVERPRVANRALRRDDRQRAQRVGIRLVAERREQGRSTAGEEERIGVVGDTRARGGHCELGPQQGQRTREHEQAHAIGCRIAARGTFDREGARCGERAATDHGDRLAGRLDVDDALDRVGAVERGGDLDRAGALGRERRVLDEAALRRDRALATGAAEPGVHGAERERGREWRASRVHQLDRQANLVARHQERRHHRIDIRRQRAEEARRRAALRAGARVREGEDAPGGQSIGNPDRHDGGTRGIGHDERLEQERLGEPAARGRLRSRLPCLPAALLAVVLLAERATVDGLVVEAGGHVAGRELAAPCLLALLLCQPLAILRRGGGLVRAGGAAGAQILARDHVPLVAALTGEHEARDDDRVAHHGFSRATQAAQFSTSSGSRVPTTITALGSVSDSRSCGNSLSRNVRP
jgi:hypothetical protein